MDFDNNTNDINGQQQEPQDYIKMDWNIESAEGRKAKVEEIIANTPPERLTSKYLEKMADYIIFAMDKEERKKKKILTDNHMVTVNKREVSFEGLVDKLESGESAVHNIITNDKNILFTRKETITQKDLKEIPYLKEIKDAIKILNEKRKGVSGRLAFTYKKWIIELGKDQYIIKEAYRKPIRFKGNFNKSNFDINLDDKIWIDAEGVVHNESVINMFDPKHVSLLLQYYVKLKEDKYDVFTSDMHYLLEDLETYIDRALEKKYPMYYDLLIYKIDGLKNVEIQEKLFEDYGIKHSVEYISSLWRNKIPKLIAEEAENDWLLWHFTVEEKGKWKKCNKCGQVKLAHNRFFSKNSTSKDGWYSICKECRNKKYQESKKSK
jgi:hypothetical protein